MWTSDDDGALDFLKKAADGKHRIVCSGDLTREQIVEAQTLGLFYVEPGGGLGWALVPWGLTTPKDRERESRYFGERPAAEETSQPKSDSTNYYGPKYDPPPRRNDGNDPRPQSPPKGDPEWA